MDNEILFRIKVQSAAAKNKIVRIQADALKIKMLSLQGAEKQITF